MATAAAVEYRLVRTDGRTLTHHMLLSDLLMVGSDELGANLLLALHLLARVKRENNAHPIEKKGT